MPLFYFRNTVGMLIGIYSRNHVLLLEKSGFVILNYFDYRDEKTN